MYNHPGIQAAAHCEITIMHNIQHKEDSTKLINVANKSLNLSSTNLLFYAIHLKKQMIAGHVYRYWKTSLALG